MKELTKIPRIMTNYVNWKMLAQYPPGTNTFLFYIIIIILLLFYFILFILWI